MSPPGMKPDGSASSADPFGRVLGHGRGLSDTTVLGAELQECKDALADARAELQAARMREDTLQDAVERLSLDLGTAQAERDRLRRQTDESETHESNLRHERDRARYAAMRSGQRDPVPGPIQLRIHQGLWTPGRPYLSYQHAWHPKTGDCYRTDKGGAPVGEMPGTGRHWEACTGSEICPVVASLPAPALEQPLQALRQTELWWDRNRTAWLIKEIDDSYLTTIIAFLRSHARRLYDEEAQWSMPFVPCAWNAYPSPAAWLTDTPLMRALLRERRRRRRRDATRRGAAGQDPRS
jgi:hypothetical protein